MQDIQYKSIGTGQASIDSAPGNFRALYQASAWWSGAVARSQDVALCGQHKVLGQWHLAAMGTWLGGTAAPGSAPRDYPAKTFARRVAGTRAHPLPGHLACVRWLSVPSGATEDATPTFTGGYGASEVGARYDGLSAAQASDDATATPSASALANNAPAQGWGAEVSRLTWTYTPKLRVGNDQLDSVMRAYSEWPRLETSVAHYGSPRIVFGVIQDTPVRLAQLHTDDDVTAHAANGGQWPHQGPRVEQADGTLYEDHRHGTERLIGAAQRQLDRVGPLVCSWSAWTDHTATPTQSEGVVTNTTTTDALLWSTSVSAYDADQPGLAVPCYYAIRYDEVALMPVTVAVVPVRITVNYTTGNTGTAVLAVHSSARSAAVITLPNAASATWYSITTQLEAMRDPGDTDVLLQAFFKCGTGTTVSIRDLIVEWGAYDDDP